MSEPITGGLRYAMERYCNFKDENRVQLSEREFENYCDAIDAIHANLERENESLRRELDRVLGESDDVPESKGHVISHVTVEVTPHIDWSRMADEVDEFVQIVRGMAGDASEHH